MSWYNPTTWDVAKPLGADSWKGLGLNVVTGGLYGGAKYAYDKSKEPYDKEAAALQKASEQAKGLADLQWQRQMQGLQQALGYTNHSQAAFDRVYGQARPAPGATMPQGLAAQMPQQGGQPQQGAGLAAFLGRGR